MNHPTDLCMHYIAFVLIWKWALVLFLYLSFLTLYLCAWEPLLLFRHCYFLTGFVQSHSCLHRMHSDFWGPILAERVALLDWNGLSRSEASGLPEFSEEWGLVNLDWFWYCAKLIGCVSWAFLSTTGDAKTCARKALHELTGLNLLIASGREPSPDVSIHAMSSHMDLLDPFQKRSSIKTLLWAWVSILPLISIYEYLQMAQVNAQISVWHALFWGKWVFYVLGTDWWRLDSAGQHIFLSYLSLVKFPLLLWSPFPNQCRFCQNFIQLFSLSLSLSWCE